jgi:DNA-directed RNA polymerase specialized sigma24 family protein
VIDFHIDKTLNKTDIIPQLMKKSNQLKKVEFEELLKWFSPDETKAGEEYEIIRSGLERYFRYRGCADPDDLADVTINRVASRLLSLDLSENPSKISIFYGFAKNIYREYLTRTSKLEFHQDTNYLPFYDLSFEDEENKEFDCLDKCLSKISDEEKQIIIGYYSKDKGDKILLRKKMAEQLGITLNALHVRVYRIKNILKLCIENCVKKKL